MTNLENSNDIREIVNRVFEDDTSKAYLLQSLKRAMITLLDGQQGVVEPGLMTTGIKELLYEHVEKYSNLEIEPALMVVSAFEYIYRAYYFCMDDVQPANDQKGTGDDSNVEYFNPRDYFTVEKKEDNNG